MHYLWGRNGNLGRLENIEAIENCCGLNIGCTLDTIGLNIGCTLDTIGLNIGLNTVVAPL